ncbi:MAG: DUF4160 domain-containing protein [Phaeodactylibacter sp.]|nr:DUF4160 domain-containing protein [Phaeodactylibacter sp.]
MFAVAAFVLMPVIAVVAGVRIYMYFNDHNPPHFHARGDGESEVFDLDGNTIEGKLHPKKSKKVRDWAKKNRKLLEDNWDENH